MTSIIKLETLSGVQDDGPLCYLLQVDQAHLLLDCGWDESFCLDYMEAVRRRASQIDAVLVSHPDVAHIGALPYLFSKCGLNCPVYATGPVFKMGQMFLYDWLLSQTNVRDFDLFTLDDIDAAFDRVQQVKHSQTVSLKGRGHGLQITPLPAGHMLGGSIWRISKMGEEEIVYAVDFNHKKERHLNGCTFEGIGRPNLLITDALNAQYEQPRRKQRDEALVTRLLGTVRGGGDVLLVIDTAGRVLEIAHLLDQLWHNADAGLITYNLVMMSNVASSVVEFAKSQVEWMSDKVLRQFEEGRHNPFQFRHVQLCHSHADLMPIRSPKVVLASGIDMEAGYSRELFLEWSADSKNTVIVTGRSAQRTLGSKLIHMAVGGDKVGRHLTLEIRRRIRLEGSELEQHRVKKRQQEQEQARIRLELVRRSSRVETVSSSDESDTEEMEVVDHPYDIMHKWEQQQKSSFFKQNKKSFPMYPFVEEKVKPKHMNNCLIAYQNECYLKWDDYGEIIRPEDYTIVESVVPHVDKLLPKEGEVNCVVPDVDKGRDMPTKCIMYVTKLEVLCQVAYIDFEGRSDGDSVRKIIAQIKPKQLIIVHGSVEASRELRQFCQTKQLAKRVFTPKLSEVVDATIESHIYQVTLSDPLMTSLMFQSVKDAELSWLDAKIRKVVPDDQVVVASADSNSDEGTRSLEPLGQQHIPSHEAVFVNDPKLSDLKQLLVNNGHQAEFSSGVLYVDNVVSIKRDKAGSFHVEGCVGDQYYHIRELVYGQFAVV